MPQLSLLAVDPRIGPLRADLLRRAVGFFGLFLMAVTWRLWTPQTDFPQVPLIHAALAWTDAFQWLGLAGMLAGLAGMFLLPAGRWLRVALGLFAACTAAMVLMDQQRLQPWAYQFVLLAVVLATSPPRSALVLLRLLIVGFYFESAMTKLDYSFLHTLGQQFLQSLASLVGASLENWSSGQRVVAAAVFPVGELLLAVGLLFESTRRAALWGAILLHGLLLLILGPLGLNHQPGVLVWNAYFIVQDVLLFWMPRSTPSEATETSNRQAVPWTAALVVGAVLALPLLEPWGWFDTWPSWGLYASSAERVVLQVHRQGRDQLSESLQPFLESPSDPAEPWLTVRLDHWALASLKAPIYPQNRVQLGIAESVARGGGLAQRARAIRLSRADRWTGARDFSVIQGAAQWDAVGGEYFFNTRPRTR